MKKNLYLLLAVILCFLLSGCSVKYSDIDNKIQSFIKTGTFNDVSTPERLSVATEAFDWSNVVLLHIGDTVSDYYEAEFDDIDGSTFEYDMGTKGVTWTVNSVEFFDSMADANIDKSKTLWDDYIHADDALQNNAFGLLDITAKYTAEPGGEQEIIISAPTFIDYDESKLSTDIETLLGDGDKKEPIVIYFSNYEDDEDDNYLTFTIKDGESVNFKLGFVTAKEFIETKNLLYICTDIDNVAINTDTGKSFTSFNKKIDNRVFDLFSGG